MFLCKGQKEGAKVSVRVADPSKLYFVGVCFFEVAGGTVVYLCMLDLRTVHEDHLLANQVSRLPLSRLGFGIQSVGMFSCPFGLGDLHFDVRREWIGSTRFLLPLLLLFSVKIVQKQEFLV